MSKVRIEQCSNCLGIFDRGPEFTGACPRCYPQGAGDHEAETFGQVDPAGKSACKPASALSTQEGGDHYKKLKIQPVEYIHANGLGYFEGSVIKYVTRWRSKNGIADLRKARHFIDLLIELEGSE